MDDYLLTLWLNADRLPVHVVRALIEEVDARRRHPYPSYRHPVTVLDHPVQELRQVDPPDDPLVQFK